MDEFANYPGQGKGACEELQEKAPVSGVDSMVKQQLKISADEHKVMHIGRTSPKIRTDNRCV